MGKLTLEEVRAAAHELSDEDREILTIELNIEMRKVDPEIEKAWITEANRRWKEFEEGKVEGIPGEEVFARIRQRLNETHNH
jgi:putative addiction module component (TIGR02574 family)